MNGEQSISIAALQAGLAWGRYMAESTGRVFATWQQMRAAAELRADVRQIAEWLQRRGRRATRREMRQAFNKSKLTPDRQDRALQSMVESAPPQLRIEASSFVLVGSGVG
jgi:hypothetical protein